MRYTSRHVYDELEPTLTPCPNKSSDLQHSLPASQYAKPQTHTQQDRSIHVITTWIIRIQLQRCMEACGTSAPPLVPASLHSQFRSWPSQHHPDAACASTSTYRVRGSKVDHVRPYRRVFPHTLQCRHSLRSKRLALLRHRLSHRHPRCHVGRQGGIHVHHVLTPNWVGRGHMP